MGKVSDIAAREDSPSHEIKTVSTRWNKVWKNMENIDGRASLQSVPETPPAPMSTFLLKIAMDHP
jgi:hypothetical protein